jgi:hypothetical protein
MIHQFFTADLFVRLFEELGGRLLVRHDLTSGSMAA